MRISTKIALALSLLVAATAEAQYVTPTAYTALNGSGYYYLDDTYTSPTSPCTGCPGALLSGGLGDLIDGTWTSNHFDVGYPAANPYVGWQHDPSFIFHFAAATNVARVRLHVDHANFAGVYAPYTVIVGASSGILGDLTGATTYSVDPNTVYDPYWIDIDVSAQGLTTANLAVGLTRGNWVFVDEFQFVEGSAVVATPEPASLVLLGTGLLGVLGVARRRK